MSDFSYDILDLLAKYGNDTEAALKGETDPKCLYAFSSLRENLFEWVEFFKDARILQVGSDYGSCTGLLAERAGEVVVLDEREENLEVNRIRHGKRGNVRFVCGTLLDDGKNLGASVPAENGAKLSGESFDYVVMAGIFELYGKEKAALILDATAGLLKPGGTLLAAAENEAGVRYWMGAKLPGTAFLESEYRGFFKALTEKYGGEFTMYYPVPDYRYPSAVYSDEYLPEPGELTNISARLDSEGLRLGSEEEAMAKACKNGIFPKFANSFLGVYRRGQL